MPGSSLSSDVQRLYRDHHGWLLGWLRGRLGCSHQAADLAQDTFLRILGRGEQAVQPREPRAYLSTLAKGLVIDFHRRRVLEQAWLEMLASVPQARQPSAEHRAVLLESLTAIDTMLDGLRPVVREAFLLSQLEGLGYQVIAERLGITVRSVNNHMSTALDHCRRLAP